MLINQNTYQKRDVKKEKKQQQQQQQKLKEKTE